MEQTLELMRKRHAYFTKLIEQNTRVEADIEDIDNLDDAFFGKDWKPKPLTKK